MRDISLSIAPTLPGSKADLDWLREVLYKSFIHLGDLGKDMHCWYKGCILRGVGVKGGIGRGKNLSSTQWVWERN